jgi:hypothetical protein
MASLLFENSTAFGQCAAGGSASGSASAGGGSAASQQAVTAIGGLMQNPCGSADASLLFETSTDFGTCGSGAAVAGSSARKGGAAVHGGTASQQAVTAVGGLQQNPCGNTAWSLLFVSQTNFHSCTPADVAAGTIASQQTVTLIGGMHQDACGSAAWSLLFETSQDFGTCGGSVASAHPAVYPGKAAPAPLGRPIARRTTR